MILMKKLLLFIALVTLTGVSQGQNTRYTVTFESHRGESFSVFMDGDLVNRMPQGRVMVSDVSDRTHEVVVVLKRPVQKAAVLNLLPGEPMVMVNVVYDERTEELSLYTPSHNRAESRLVTLPSAKAVVEVTKELDFGGKVEVAVVPPDPVTEEDLQGMIARMKGQTFDSDRLALGKVIVASSALSASQIARLAEMIDYSSSQVEFLKYAYAYCVDPQNYYTTVDILTFSSDKRKVLDYIATQK